MTPNTDPGGLIIFIGDVSTSITMYGGGSWTIPVGALSLVEGELERAARPGPAQLTNALGIVTDHLDDVMRDEPKVLSTPSVAIAGNHARVLAQVEVGSDQLPSDYVLERVDADEVFRTLVAEPIGERIHNPGLPPDDVETVIGTCCIVLAIMRRLELTSVDIVEVPFEPGD
jgi:exopolyphosphatase / guanosine-5'-triphosphate,3'-diphosphate pyrophosphatase